MNETDIRDLMRQASLEALRGPGTDLDAVVRRGRRSARLRRGALGLVAVAVLAGAVGAPVLWSGQNGSAAVATADRSTPATSAVVRLVSELIPGAVVAVQQPGVVAGSYSSGGVALARITLTAYDNASGTDGLRNPCLYPVPPATGPTLAPVSKEVCNQTHRPDGSTAWFRRASLTSPQADRVIYRHRDGIVVTLALDDIDSAGAGASPAWDIPDSALLAVVTAPEVRVLAGASP